MPILLPRVNTRAKVNKTSPVGASHLTAEKIDVQIKIKLASFYKAACNDTALREDRTDWEIPSTKQVRVEHDTFTIEYLDPKYEKFDEFAGLTWLEPIDVVAIDKHTSVPIGHCTAKLIRKLDIASRFHDLVKRLRNEVTMLGFDLFDCHGRLREDYRRKVSGYWKTKLEAGTVLLIEDVTIDHPYQGRGIDTQMLKALLRATREKVKGSSLLAITWPEPAKATLFCETFEILVGNPGVSQVLKPIDPKSTARFRKLGFRRIETSIWFGLVVEDQGDVNRTRTIDYYFDPLPGTGPIQRLPEPVLRAFTNFDDIQSLQILEEHYGHLAPDSDHWLATDQAGNTVLHLAAQLHFPKCVGWILDHEGRRLPRVRNMNRDTPRQAIQLTLEKIRSRRLILPSYIVVMRTFPEYPDDAIWCLAKMDGINLEYKDKAWKQLAAGCSCGRCIEGCLSPRMRLKLSSQAEVDHESFETAVAVGPFNFAYGELPAHGFVRECCWKMIARSLAAAQGCVNLLNHISDCLEKALLPTVVNVMRVHDKEGKNPVATDKFFKCGGSVAQMVRMVFERALWHEVQYLDEPQPYGIVVDWMQLSSDDYLPECRNDYDYRYVRRKCGIPVKRLN
ncbi:hypothetical protein PV08_04044 [Exophiala spinifera]|uniref:N-acetyltransferase domain-containing protein n=1 Tax=Exophiala spinifera TaxID=91928 RepID=A0A0D2BZS5_9EURO|nr:uncharacterized protein PV08_04044 [Exophiala spinifera]KIW16854.1 hypothetical protein PV08_04044 [Exophiala spinifera]